MRLKDHRKVSELLRVGLARKQMSLKELVRQEAARLGKSYQTIHSYYKGNRVPQTEEERIALADAFGLLPGERQLLLNIAGDGTKPVVESLAGLTATDLKLFSFTDIQARYFTSETAQAGIPSRVYVFATGEPLALHSKLIMSWLDDYLKEPGRQLTYAFPHPGPGEDNIRKLFELVDFRAQGWKSDLVAVESSFEIDPDAFTLMFHQKPLPQIFGSFLKGTVVFALPMEEGLPDCFVTMPVDSDFTERILVPRTHWSHPPVLYKSLERDASRDIQADIELLEEIVQAARKEGLPQRELDKTFPGVEHLVPVRVRSLCFPRRR